MKPLISGCNFFLFKKLLDITKLFNLNNELRTMLNVRVLWSASNLKLNVCIEDTVAFAEIPVNAMGILAKNIKQIL